MVSVLFVINSIRPGSGAELVLADYLASETRIKKSLLFLGSFDNAPLFNCCGVSDVYVYKPKFAIDTRLSRFLTMELESRRLARDISLDEDLKRWLASVSPDVVYFDNSFEGAMFKNSLFREMPCICHIHDMVGMFRSTYRRCVIASCNQAESVITVSRAARDELIRYGVPGEKIAVAYNPFIYQKRSAHVAPLGQRQLRVGFVGSTIARKGFDLLPSILTRLSSMLTETSGYQVPISLSVVTKSPVDRYYRKVLLNFGEEISISSSRNLTRQQTQEFYRSMDFVIVPSRKDPFPTVVLESIMNGIPCFASKTDGVPEMLAYEGFMFDFAVPESAPTTIRKWLELSVSEQKSIIDRCQRHVIESFSVDSKRDTIYRAILKAAGRVLDGD